MRAAVTSTRAAAALSLSLSLTLNTRFRGFIPTLFPDLLSTPRFPLFPTSISAADTPAHVAVLRTLTLNRRACRPWRGPSEGRPKSSSACPASTPRARHPS
eukprot:3931865-Rhodomonas_salina.1